MTASTHQTHQTDAQFLEDGKYRLTSKYNVEVLLALTNTKKHFSYKQIKISTLLTTQFSSKERELCGNMGD